MGAEGTYLDRHDYRVLPTSLEVAVALVERYHYAGGGANTATYAHGLFARHGFTPLGVAWWIPPTRRAAEATWDGDFREVLALSRLVLVPGLPTNAASFLIAGSVRLIRRDGRFRCLVTYADTWRGHTGAIYRATNWEYLGLTAPERAYVGEDGRLVARKAGPRTRTHVEMLALGHRCLGSFAKHKYRLVLPPSRKRGEGQMALPLEVPA